MMSQVKQVLKHKARYSFSKILPQLNILECFSRLAPFLLHEFLFTCRGNVPIKERDEMH